MQMKTKDFEFEVKALAEDGTFEGYLSVFGAVDLGNDLVEKGAFTKTINEQGGSVVMLWQHDKTQPIGRLQLAEDDHGLKVIGKLILEVGRAREAHALLKEGAIKGLSIGYRAIKEKVVEGVRRLKEIQLFEGSIVTFPMLVSAQITSVKADEQKADFSTELSRAQVIALRGMMFDSLWRSLDSIIYGYDGNSTAEERVAAARESIDQFRNSYLSHLPVLFELWGVKNLELPAASTFPMSLTTKAQIEEAISNLKALLPETYPVEPPNEKSAEPDIHSLLSVFDKFKLAGV